MPLTSLSQQGCLWRGGLKKAPARVSELARVSVVRVVSDTKGSITGVPRFHESFVSLLIFPVSHEVPDILIADAQQMSAVAEGAPLPSQRSYRLEAQQALKAGAFEATPGAVTNTKDFEAA